MIGAIKDKVVFGEELNCFRSREAKEVLTVVDDRVLSVRCY